MRMDRLFGGASRYAHLAALIPQRAARAEDDDQEPKDAKRSRAADDEEDDDAEPKGKKSKRAEDPDQYPDEDDSEPKGKKSKAADDDDDADDDDEPKSRKARRAEDDEDDTSAEDDDDKEEMTGKSAVAKARSRERARCKAIFSHPVAAQNVALAASLAFDTTMTRKEAVAVLKGQQGQGGARDYRGDRSRRNPDLGPGAESAPTGKQAQASSWSRALGKAGARTR